ncbi:MAG TPA: DUF2269 family protein [Acidimicrobiales bacterium]|nr:DUF2269 family protein [Acidimicrobiales bacterium]
MSAGFKVLLTLHLLCVIGGFGYLAYSGVTLVVGRRRGAAIGTLEVTLQVGLLAELLIYGAVIFGIGAVGSSHHWKFQQTWVWLALVLYVVALGILHGLIKRSQREYATLARQLSQVGPVRERPPQIDRIESLEQRIAFGWGVFNLLVVAVVCLMVWKPGA